MDPNVYTLTFLTPENEVATMTSYGWGMALKDCDIATTSGWELISLVRVRVRS